MRLNLGAGTHRPTGFTHVDLAGADVDLDLGAFPWPWAADSVREIVASHVLEHLDRRAGLLFLLECRRILAPEGVLRLAVPDMDKFIDCHNERDWKPLEGYRWTDFNYFLGGNPEAEGNPAQRHRYMYTWDSLAHKLEAVGFRHVLRRAGPGEWDNPQYAPISLYVDAFR